MRALLLIQPVSQETRISIYHITRQAIILHTSQYLMGNLSERYDTYFCLTVLCTSILKKKY